jgi:hypothetical protein
MDLRNKTDGWTEHLYSLLRFKIWKIHSNPNRDWAIDTRNDIESNPLKGMDIRNTHRMSTAER